MTAPTDMDAMMECIRATQRVSSALVDDIGAAFYKAYDQFKTLGMDSVQAYQCALGALTGSVKGAQNAFDRMTSNDGDCVK